MIAEARHTAGVRARRPFDPFEAFGPGRSYRFVAPPALAKTGLWLLSSVTGPLGTTVQLEYEIATPFLGNRRHLTH